ncbi:MAG TPA: hypothetical protein VEX38_07965, partial [Fimbriimonadaceae bacterium]|nr:hypothetical protein [Fimbriimonadaceae bacterium]
MDAEAIYRKTPEELRKCAEQAEREFLESGPPELLPMREAILEHRERYRTILCDPEIAKAGQAQEGTAVLEAWQNEGRELDRRYQAAHRNLEVQALPPAKRARGLELLEERDRVITATHEEGGLAGRYGAASGRRFSILRQLDEAKAAGDVTRVTMLESELGEAKVQAEAVAAELSERKAKVEEIRAKYQR